MCESITERLHKRRLTTIVLRAGALGKNDAVLGSYCFLTMLTVRSDHMSAVLVGACVVAKQLGIICVDMPISK
jgi:hypothetical protein